MSPPTARSRPVRGGSEIDGAAGGLDVPSMPRPADNIAAEPPNLARRAQATGRVAY